MARPSGWIAAIAFIADLVVRHVWSGALVFAVIFLIPATPRHPSREGTGADTVFLMTATARSATASFDFLIAEDPEGSRFVFFPLESEKFLASIPEETTLPDSVVLLPASEGLLTKFAAVADALQRLGGYWRVLGVMMRIVPRPLGDAMYDFIAARRMKVFGRTEEACPLMPPKLRERFEL